MKELPQNNKISEQDLHQIIQNLMVENGTLKNEIFSLEDKNSNLMNDNFGLQNLTNNLQSNITKLQDLNLCLHNDIFALENDKLNLQGRIDHLEHQLALLRAKSFGSSSEKIKNAIEDIEGRLEDEAINNADLLEDEFLGAEEEIPDKVNKKQKVKNKPKRKKLPDNLERKDIILEPDSRCPDCGSEDFRKIGEDVSETLDRIPAKLIVTRYIRPRCVCINCERVVQAYPASKPIDKGIAEAGLLAHILVQKYAYHMPLYRQSTIYKNEGLEISRSTMASWVGKSYKLLIPLIDELKKDILSSSHLHGDDTPVKVLAPGFGRTKTGRLWVYVRDGRNYHEEAPPPAACYFYSPDRKGIRPEEHLKDFKGVLHSDAYSGFNGLLGVDEGGKKRIEQSCCWAHARRKFYEVCVTNPKATIATRALKLIGELYAIEDRIRGLKIDERYKERQKESKKLVDKIFADWKVYYKELPKKSVTAAAIAYSLNHETELRMFLSDGMIEIDNNIAERALRSIAVGRSNWLFAGSDSGGESAAGIYSLIESAKLNELDPWKYLKHVIGAISDYNHKRLPELLPWNVKL